MASGKISKRSIDALRAGNKIVFLWDTDLKGFGAKITPAGAISYVLQFRMGGARGKYPPLYNRRTRLALDTDNSSD